MLEKAKQNAMGLKTTREEDPGSCFERDTDDGVSHPCLAHHPLLPSHSCYGILFSFPRVPPTTVTSFPSIQGHKEGRVFHLRCGRICRQHWISPFLNTSSIPITRDDIKASHGDLVIPKDFPFLCPLHQCVLA